MYNCFIVFFYKFCFIYIKISKISSRKSAKYYQEKKKEYKKARERYQNLSKEEKEKSNNMIVNVQQYDREIFSGWALFISRTWGEK